MRNNNITRTLRNNDELELVLSINLSKNVNNPKEFIATSNGKNIGTVRLGVMCKKTLQKIEAKLSYKKRK